MQISSNLIHTVILEKVISNIHILKKKHSKKKIKHTVFHDIIRPQIFKIRINNFACLEFILI